MNNAKLKASLSSLTLSLSQRERGFWSITSLAILSLAGCVSPDPEGLAPSIPAATTVKMDFFHHPFPDIPLPNNLATRYDAASATGRRLNASMIAPTGFEENVRRHLDQLDGWGVFQPITVPFTGPLDVASILAGHRDKNYDLGNDVIYLINVDRASAHFGKIHPLDVGNGNYPVILKDRANYWPNDPRGDSLSLTFEEADEDKNGDGILQPSEDSDADGLLDRPNYLPGKSPAPTDLAGRADALMTFYERQTNTLIVRPLEPLDERTRYAVVVTRRLKDAGGAPVGSPFPFIAHTSQTEALSPLPEVLPAGLSITDIAFAFTFTTQTVDADVKAVRDGLYGHGAQAHLGAEFPAEIATLEPMRDHFVFPDAKMPHLMYGEDWSKLAPLILQQFEGEDPNKEKYKKDTDSLKYIDYFVIGSFQSPQLFNRVDTQGKPLPFDDQSWPPDLDRTAAPARAETIYFTLVVPRKEVSARGQGKPAPLVILSHGYGGNRFDAMNLGGHLARHGLATLAIDGPSHGLPLAPDTRAQVMTLFAGYGLELGGKALMKDRAFDQNHDGAVDSGADFWSAYTFHTRDMVRQFMLDYMQLVRIFRTFDGTRRWQFDVNGDGQPELAGDFDADGAVDVGAGAPIFMMGGSLGGMMSMIMGGAEPEITAIAPISGGGGLSDIGLRSRQGGVPEAFILRTMCPIYIGTIDPKVPNSTDMKLELIVPDLNRAAQRTIATVKEVKPGDTVVVENLANGKRGCGYVSATGTVRASVQSDVGDRTRILFYSGAQLSGDTECTVRTGAPAPRSIIDTFQSDVLYQGHTFTAGSPLVALAEGLGLRRAHPDLRRFQGLGQVVLDPSDPAVFARHLQVEPLVFAGAGSTTQKTGAHALIITTGGDMSVPASSGMTYDRAAGLLEYLKDDPRYGTPDNQMLIDHHIGEAVNTLGRYTDPMGNGVMFDVENFSRGGDMWGKSIPRLEQPIHNEAFAKMDRLGGKSAAIFPYTHPEGQHGFDLPGSMTDDARALCRAACQMPGTTDPCGCITMPTYDVGNFMINLIGRFFASAGTWLGDDLCMSADACPPPFDWQAPPAPRPISQRP